MVESGSARTVQDGSKTFHRNGQSLCSRLILRPLELNDLQECHAIRLQAEVMEWMAEGRPDQTLQQTEDWLRKRIDPPMYCFAIEEVHDSGNVFIGSLGCHAVVPLPTFGITISSRFWGKGYATEAMSLWLKMWWKYIETELKTMPLPQWFRISDHSKLIAYCLAENVKSKKVLERGGFERTSEERLFHEGRWINAETWLLQRADQTLNGQ